MKYWLWLTLGGWAFAFSIAHAQQVQRASGEAVLLVPENMTLVQARAQVRDLAVLDALQNAFGTSIVQGIATRMQAEGTERPETFFNLVADSYVKGEWLETTSEVFSEETRRGPGNTAEVWLRCNIAGTVRELTQPRPMLELEPLNCPSPQCKVVRFMDNDPMFLLAKAPTDGYLQVYLEDDETVYCLMPYQSMPREMPNAFRMTADQPYILFSPRPEHNYFRNPAFQEDELELTSEGPQTFHRLYAVFSTKAMPKPLTEPGKRLPRGYTAPRWLPRAQFQKWLAQTKLYGDAITIQVVDILVVQP